MRAGVVPGKEDGAMLVLLMSLTCKLHPVWVGKGKQDVGDNGETRTFWGEPPILHTSKI